MKYGLTEEQLAEIITRLKRYSEVEEAILFGSRAKNTYKEASDVDIAIKGEKVSASLAAKIKFDLEEDTYLPFFFDVIAYPTITNLALVENIDTNGIELFAGDIGWKEVKLSSLASKIGSGATPKGGSNNYKNYGVSLIRSQNILDFRFCADGLAFIDEEQAYELRNVIVQENDVLLNITGDSVARCCQVPIKVLPARVNQHVAIIRLKPEIASFSFIKYLLLYSKENLLVMSEIGATRNALTKGMLEDFSFFLPTLPEQRAIANVLSSLDDKIDMLHRQNKTLEAMAETLFRQWFIEEARDDWNNLPIADIVSLKGGTTPSTKQNAYWDGEICWTSPRDLSNHSSIFLFDTEKKITNEGLSKISSGLLPVGTVLLSSRAPIGYLAITDVPVAINQGYIAIICNGIVSAYFMYLWCKNSMEYIKSVANGATFEEVSKSSFRELTISIPDNSTLNDFDEVIRPIFSKIKTNKKQLVGLEKLRDTLLPKLMSGEVRVDYNHQDVA